MVNLLSEFLSQELVYMSDAISRDVNANPAIKPTFQGALSNYSSGDVAKMLLSPHIRHISQILQNASSMHKTDKEIRGELFLAQRSLEQEFGTTSPEIRSSMVTTCETIQARLIAVLKSEDASYWP